MRTKVIYRATEWSDTEIPLSLVMDGGRLDLHKDILGRGYFQFSLKRDKLVLSAGSFVGLIPLNDRVSLMIEPKIGRENWLYLVGKAHGYLRGLNYLRWYSRVDHISRSVVEFLSRALLVQLRPVEEGGLLRRYCSQQVTTPFPRGRLLFNESLKRVWPYGHQEEVAVQYYVFSPDTAHNRLIRYALHLAARYLAFVPETSSSLSRQLTDYENLFASIPLDGSLRYLPAVITSLKKGSIPETRSYYSDACRTALLLVEHAGLSPQLMGSDSTLTFVVNMEAVFQQYCYNVLLEARDSINRSVSVLSEPEGNIALFSGLDCDPRRAQPDIQYNLPSVEPLLIEVKYKHIPSRDDINQAITYALAFKVSKIVLLCYAQDSSDVGWTHLGQVGDRIDVWVYRLDLSVQDMSAQEGVFQQDMHRMALMREQAQ